MSELLPCPFCGGEARTLKLRSLELCWYAACENGGLKGDCQIQSCDTRCYATEQEAIEAWNTRAERTCTMDIKTDWHDAICYSCSNCGEYQDFEYRYCPHCGARVVGDAE